MGNSIDNLVKCLVCGAEVKSISPHLRSHPPLRLADYREQFKDPLTGEFPPVGWLVQSVPKAPQTASKGPAKPSKEELSATEQQKFDARFKVLFLQAEEDPALEPTIREIVKNEVSIDQWQGMITDYTSMIKENPTVLDQILALGKLVKEAQSSNLASMNSLALTRKAKKDSKQGVQTTPSRLVSGFEMFLKTSNSETLRRANEDMAESAARARRNFDALSKELIVDEDNDGEPDEDMVPPSL